MKLNSKAMKAIVKKTVKFEVEVLCQVLVRDEVVYEDDNTGLCRSWARDEGLRGNYELRWSAAEIIDAQGNTNIPAYGATRREAIENLLKTL
jgi:hypothetical protein